MHMFYQSSFLAAIVQQTFVLFKRVLYRSKRLVMPILTPEFPVPDEALRHVRCGCYTDNASAAVRPAPASVHCV